jgi:hypothetical protein
VSRAAALTLAVLAAGAGAPGGAAAATPSARLIVPGVGVGRGDLGDTRAVLRAAYGRPQSVSTRAATILWRWPRRGLEAEFARRGARAGRAVAITASSPGWATAAGIAPGRSLRAAVVRANPGAACDDEDGTCLLAGPRGRRTVFSYGEDAAERLVVAAVTVEVAP